MARLELSDDYQRVIGRVPIYRRGRVPRPLSLSAVIVPTNRACDAARSGLALAARIAEQHDCQLVVLRSGAATRSPYPLDLVPRTTAPIAVIDLPGRLPREFQAMLPARHSDQLPLARRFHRSDVGLKRTLGIAFGRWCGWEAALLLDDDLRARPPSSSGRPPPGSPAGPPDDVDGGLAALRLDDVLSDFAGDPRLMLAGYDAVDFRDHSVLGHIRRTLGRAQGTAIGGAMVLRCAGPLPFFGAGYNEDWLFQVGLMLAEASSMPSCAVKYVGPLFQDPFDHLHPARAQAEELGDLLAEGLFDLLATGREDLFAEACCAGYWQLQGRRRRDEMNDLLTAVRRRGRTPECDQLYELLSASLAVYTQVQRWPEELAGYLRAWRHDLAAWPAVLDAVAPPAAGGRGDLPSAVASFGLAGRTSWLGGRAAEFSALHGRWA